MTLVKRTQGRPPRSSGINGRDKLIEATRLYLQSNRKMSLTRTEIAHGCGVTPALISYYFKDKKSLLDAVTKPLVKIYRQQLGLALAVDGSAEDKMRRVIRLLLELNRENAFLVDYTLRDIASQQIDAEDRAVIDVFHDAIAGLSGELVALGVWHSTDPMMTEVALWGMCRAFGEMMRVSAAGHPEPEALAAALDRKVDFVFRSFASRSAQTCAE
jgi:AcrR family transcriptional regulator